MRIFKKSILVFALLFVLSFSPLFSLADSVNYPLSIIDNTGTIVNILQEPQRIISTSPENTEILFALGLKDKIVGITN